MSTTASPTVLRRAEVRDDAAVGALTVAAYTADGFVGIQDAYASQLSDAAARREQAELWVAEIEGDLAGTVTFCPPGSGFREVAEERESEFRMLAVDPAHRRRGVAAALTDLCVRRSHDLDLDLDAVVLCSLPDQTPAQEIYRRMGFVRLPARDWSPGPGIDLRCFRLDLRVDAGTAARPPRRG